MFDTQEVKSVNRRGLIGHVLAGGILANFGCQNSTDVGRHESSSRRQKPIANLLRPTETFKTTRRIFEFEVDATAYGSLAVLFKKIRAVGGVPSEEKYHGANQNHGMFAWIDPKSVPGLLKIADVVKGERVSPESVVDRVERIRRLRGSTAESTTEGRRHFFVILGPNSWNTDKPPGSFEVTKDVATRWAAQLHNLPDVTVEAVASESWSKIKTEGFYIGPVEGQIKVTVPSGGVPPQVLTTIKAHPQVMRMQWDYPEDVYHCPPCGQG